MTPAEHRAEELALKYVDARGWPRKGDSRESYNTLMRYEVRDELIEAHIDGQEVGLLSVKDQPEVLALITSLESIVIGQDNLDRLDEVDCKTRKMLLIHMSMIASDALKQWKSFVGEK